MARCGSSVSQIRAFSSPLVTVRCVASSAMGNSESGGDDGADWTTPKAVALVGLKNRTSGGTEAFVGRSGLGARVRAIEKLNSESSWILLVQPSSKKVSDVRLEDVLRAIRLY